MKRPVNLCLALKRLAMLYGYLGGDEVGIAVYAYLAAQLCFAFAIVWQAGCGSLILGAGFTGRGIHGE